MDTQKRRPPTGAIGGRSPELGLSRSCRPRSFVAVARVKDGVDADRGAEWLDSLCDLVSPAQDGAREVAKEQVVAAGGERHDARDRRYPCEVGQHAVCRVPVAREVDELDAELARELPGRSSAAHAGVVVDGDAVPRER
jgi:hypothetical protein